MRGLRDFFFFLLLVSESVCVVAYKHVSNKERKCNMNKKVMTLAVMCVAAASLMAAPPPPRGGGHHGRHDNRHHDKHMMAGGILHAVGAVVGLIDHTVNKPEVVVAQPVTPVVVSEPAPVVVHSAPAVVAKPAPVVVHSAPVVVAEPAPVVVHSAPVVVNRPVAVKPRPMVLKKPRPYGRNIYIVP